MAVVRVKTVGRGIDRDPIRAPLPTYQEILTDYDAGYTLVNVPDSEFHDDPAKIDPNGTKTSFGHRIRKLDDAGHKAWHEHLDERYRERKGEFRPEIV